jgi:hypothetical protein
MEALLSAQSMMKYKYYTLFCACGVLRIELSILSSSTIETCIQPQICIFYSENLGSLERKWTLGTGGLNLNSSFTHIHVVVVWPVKSLDLLKQGRFRSVE